MSGVQIKDYLLLFKNENSIIHKKNKKKLSKRRLFKALNFDLIKYDDQVNILMHLKKYLLMAKKKHVSYCGILYDTNVIIHDITYIPPMPKQYDVLCLESEIDSYKKDDDSIYWTKTNILHSGNFIVNGNSIDKILDIIKDSKDLQSFYKNLNKLSVYTITQYNLSEKEKNYVHDPLVINKKLTQDDILNYDSKLSKDFYEKFQSMDLKVDKLQSIVIKSELLPKVSLICPFTDKNNFFHALLTFLRLDYPRHLLELVIVDDTNSEKELNLPEDSRLRLINIDNKTGSSLPLGYKLNAGIKHSSNELIMNFFDTSNYNLNLREIISHFILSGKDCVISKDIGIYNKSDSTSCVISMPDLSNCVYTKKFWSRYAFEEVSHKFYINCDLMYKWIASRVNEVSFIPFVYMSFKLKFVDDVLFFENSKLTLDLSKLVDKKIKESFDLL